MDHYDVIIIGTGAGGGTLARKLAPSGKRILLLERGGYLPREPENWSSREIFREERYLDDELWYDKDGNPYKPHQQYFVGFYGAILFRLLAGFAGTAAMTISSTLEAKLRGRAPSSAPARATAKVLGISAFEDGVARARFNDLSHWGYGTGWGVVRGLLDAVGLPPRKATAAHGAAVWGSAQVTLAALDIAPPAIFWPKAEIAIDAFHHTVYALATGLAYELLGSSGASS